VKKGWAFPIKLTGATSYWRFVAKKRRKYLPERSKIEPKVAQNPSKLLAVFA
jgi:hypothetical protein